MSYKDRNKKLVTLPSGATVKIRKLNGYDFMGLGEIPEPLALAAKGGKAPPADRTPSKEETEWGVRLARYMLTRATQDFTFEGETFVIVDKPSIDTSPTELSIEDLEQADAQAIVDEATRLNGMRREDAEAARPFPEKSQADDPGSSTCEALPKVANGNP